MAEPQDGTSETRPVPPRGQALATADIVQSAVEEERPIPARTVALIGAATFGASLAGVVPMVFSLAVRLGEIAPGNEHLYGYVIGAGQMVTLISAPLTGVLSDRCRSPWGRRRPFVLLGVVMGVLALPLLSAAPNVAVLTLGWMLTAFGWGTAGGSVGNLLADRLPRHQRGTVSAVTSVTGQVAPVVGVALAGQYATDSWLLFLIPGMAGGALIMLFLVFVREDPVPSGAVVEPLSWSALARSYMFNPRRYPVFAWAWLGRFVFFLGLSLTSSFTTYFYAQRLQLSLPEVAPTLAVLSAVGVGAAMLGSSIAGWASDRLGTRHGWTALGGAVFAAGALVSASAHGLALLAVGGVISALGLAVFSTVGGALTMDVLPERATQAGRYLGVNAFSQKIPAALAPLLAPSLLLVSGGHDPDYGTLYLAGAACALVGAVIIATRAKAAAWETADVDKENH